MKEYHPFDVWSETCQDTSTKPLEISVHKEKGKGKERDSETIVNQ